MRFFARKLKCRQYRGPQYLFFDKRAVATSNLLPANSEYADRMICFWVNMPAYVRDFQHKLN